MNKLEIIGKTLRVQVKTNPRANKTVRIDFESPSQLTVLIPEDADINVMELLKQNRDLVKRKHKELMNKIPILDDSGILYKGERYRLEPHVVDSFDDEKVVIKDDLIHVYHHHERPVLKVVEKWLSQKTLDLIKQVQAEHPGLRDPTRISVTDTTRWGYTHDNRVIIYNWQLAALPQRTSTLRDYT